MTGFARAHGVADSGAAGGAWAWELRSVNGKGLDLRLRLPAGIEAIEADCRRILSARFSRGNIQAVLQFARHGGEGVPIVNEAALEAVLAALTRLSARLGSPPPTAEAVLQIRGVLEPGEQTASEEEIADRNAAIVDGLDRAAEALVQARLAEGSAIASVLEGQIEAIGVLVDAIERDPSRSMEAIRARLGEQIAPLLEVHGLDPVRLHQEAALLATRSDLREELDRLKAHVDAVRKLLCGAGPAGRKLDFLAQEFNRECNTICSKSNAAAVTAAGLEMKVLIDQFREQVQNIE